MRTLRFFSFGPSCSCWTVASSPRACASSALAFVPVGVRFREQQAGIRQHSVVAEVLRSGASGDVAERLLCGSHPLRESASTTTVYGGFGVSGGLGGGGHCCSRRLYSQIASKKGKKAEKDVLVEDREAETTGVLLVEDHRGEDGEIGELDGKTKTKKKKKEKGKVLPSENGDAVAAGALGEESMSVATNVHISGDGPDAEQGTKVKKEKRKKSKSNLKQTEEISETESGSGAVLNGAASVVEDIPETTLQPEIAAKGKKKSKSKSKGSEVEDELPEFESDSESASVMEDVLAVELEEHLDDDDFWEDDFEPEPELNDGGDGGGIVLGDAPWAKSALELAEKVVAEFNGALEIFAFKVSKDSGIIRLRVDKLSDKYGSPSMDEIQQISSSYSKLLDKAEEARTIPDDLALEVSSPGAERVVRLPQDLERFKDLPMYVRYIESSGDSGAEPPEMDGVLELESVDMEGGSAKWKLADVRLNRDLAGKGRGLTRKQKDWRVNLPFETIQLVRLYIDL